MEYTYDELLGLYTNRNSELLVENEALEAEVFALCEEMVNLKDYIAKLEKDLEHYYSLIND